MRPGRRWLLAGGAVLVAAMAGLAWFFLIRSGDEAEYVTGEVTRGTIASTVMATGTVDPVATVLVGTYVSGRIQALEADFNSHVEKGQRVAKIDPAPFLVKEQQARARVATARARIDKARAELRLRKATWGRQQRLRAERVVSEDEMDLAISGHDQAVAQLALEQAALQEAEAALAEARVNLEYTDILSPVEGVVLSRNVDVGQTVAATFQTPTLFVIAEDLSKMQVNANVSEADIGPVESGQTASFTVDAYPSSTFSGTVVQVRNDPVIVENVVTYDVIIDVDNSSLDLKPGMTATVNITTNTREDVLALPLRALRFRPATLEPKATSRMREAATDSTIWLVDGEDDLRAAKIELGIRSDDEVEVLSGEVAEGDVVVLGYLPAAGTRRRSMRHGH